MILEENDIYEYLKTLTNDELVNLILSVTDRYEDDAEIAEKIADTCREHLTRYRLIDE